MSRVKKVISSPLGRKRQSAGAKRMFGLPLDEVMRDAAPGAVVPRLVVKICEFIEQEGMDLEGVFRVSGNQKIVEKLKAEFDTRGDADLMIVQDVAAVASVLKHFLRELPVPLIPNEMKPQFLGVYAKNQDNQEACAKELATLVSHLPAAHFQLLKYVLKFLVKVAHNEPQNKMGIIPLAIVFGPNIFRLSDGLAALKEQQFTNGVVAVFLQHFDVMFKELNEESPKSKARAPPVKPLPFREHAMAKKQNRMTIYGGMDEKDGHPANMTICEDRADNHAALEDDVFAKTLNEKDLLTARERRRLSANPRPLPDPSLDRRRRLIAHHHYEEVILKDDETPDDKESMPAVYAVPNKTKKTRQEVKVVEVAPSSNAKASLSSQPEASSSAGLTEVNMFHFNTVNGFNGIEEEDRMRSASPWSVSSDAVSPLPTTPRQSQLGGVVHATVMRHLFGPCVHNLSEDAAGYCNGDIELKSEELEVSRRTDEGATNSQQHDVKSHVADWEERIVRSQGLTLPSDVVSDDSPVSRDTRKNPKRKKPDSKAFELFENSGRLLHFRPPPDDTPESVTSQVKSTKTDKPAVLPKPSKSQRVDVRSNDRSLAAAAASDQLDEFDSVERHSTTGMLTSLTSRRPAAPRNRRRPSHVRHEDDKIVVTDFDGHSPPVFSDARRPAAVPPLDLSKLGKSSGTTQRGGNTKVTAWSSEERQEEAEEKATEDTVQAFCPSPEVPHREAQTTNGGTQKLDCREAQTTGRREAVTTDRLEAQTTNGGTQTTGRREAQTTGRREAETTDRREAQTTNGGTQRTDRREAQTTDRREAQTTGRREALTTDGGNRSRDARKGVDHQSHRVDSQVEQIGNLSISDVTANDAECRNLKSGEGGETTRREDVKSTNEEECFAFDGLSLKELTREYRIRRQRIHAHQAEFEKENGRRPDRTECGPVRNDQREYHVLKRLIRSAKRTTDAEKDQADDRATDADKVGAESVPQSRDLPPTSPPAHEIATHDGTLSVHDLTTSLSVSSELLSQLSGDDMQRLSALAVTMTKSDADLAQKRGLKLRPDDPTSMTFEQLREEKQNVQRALLALEKSYGRPRNQAEKDVTRPIYNRYRLLKQILTDWEQSGMPTSSTITAMQMAEEKRKVTERRTLSVQELKGRTSPKELADSGIQADRRPSTAQSQSGRSDELASSVDAPAPLDFVISPSDVFSSTSPVEMLSSLSTEELQRELEKEAKRKKELRATLKKFENKFEETHRRKVAKGDRSAMASEYEQYKKVKSSMKHIERLLCEKGFTGTNTV
ncbi:uncharacterized protein LOC134187556 isoform X2 [Corticium candelabrum]|nr:uncharacterized protein LOC134187556 isoform X2 [Corticium candelabrum]